MNAADVVAYQYGDDGAYCVDHIMHVLPTGPGEEFDGWALAEGVTMDPVENLREIARAFGRQAEVDVTRFPQPMFATPDTLEFLADRVCGFEQYTDNMHTIGERL